jgi:hypothetical protein
VLRLLANWWPHVLVCVWMCVLHCLCAHLVLFGTLNPQSLLPAKGMLHTYQLLPKGFALTLCTLVLLQPYALCFNVPYGQYYVAQRCQLVVGREQGCQNGHSCAPHAGQAACAGAWCRKALQHLML